MEKLSSGLMLIFDRCFFILIFPVVMLIRKRLKIGIDGGRTRSINQERFVVSFLFSLSNNDFVFIPLMKGIRTYRVTSI